MSTNVINNKVTHAVALGLLVAPLGVSVATNQFMTTTKANAKTTGTSTSTSNANNNLGSGGIQIMPLTDDGYYQYCMNAGVPDQPNNTAYGPGSTAMDVGSNIAALGPVRPGDKPIYNFQSTNERDQVTAVQYAIWIALGQGGHAEGFSRGSVNSKLAAASPSVRADVQGLLNYSGNGSKNINTTLEQEANGKVQDAVNNAKSDAQNAVNQQVQNAIQSWKTSAQNDVQKQANDKAAAQYGSLSNLAASNALKMVHFTQDKTSTSPADKKALPHFEDGASMNHSDSVKYGAHVFDYTLSHDEASAIGDSHISNVDFGSGAAIQFNKKLPKDTVIVANGKTVTTDASKTDTYSFPYGKVEIRVPFSDTPDHDSANMIGTFTVKGHIQTDTFSAAASSEASATQSGSQTAPVKVFTKYEVLHPGYQTTVTTIHEEKQTAPVGYQVSASASGAVSASASSAGDFTHQSSANLQLQWKSLLTNFVIKKTDENNVPLRGVTFELVQSSVANSDVLKTGPGKYVLATDNGQLISLPKVTDKDGTIRWDNLAYGKYTLLEIQTNNHHVIDSNPIDLTADRHHADDQLQHIINNKDGKISLAQTQRKKPTPEIHTTATGENGSKLILGAGKQNISDTVTFTGLEPGKTYHMVGQFMDQATGKKIDGLHGEQTFKAADANGQIKVNFSADTSKFAGKSIVAFETLYSDNSGKPSSVVATHADIHDSGQTVRVTKPSIHTTATVNGQKSISPSGEVTVKDTVQYEGLVPGMNMNMNGHMVNKDNGQSISNVSTKNFTPSSENGTVDVDIKTDASKMGQKGMVAFEQLKDSKGQTIAVHEDINDNGQTINRVKPAVGYGMPGSPVQQNLVQTATNAAKNNVPAIAFLASAVLLAGSGLVYKKDHSRN